MPMPKPKTEGNYLKAPGKGQSVTFRVLGDPVEYYMGFKTTQNGSETKMVCVRKAALNQFTPGTYDTVGKFGPQKPRYAMAFPVLNEAGTVMVFEVAQKTILDGLYQLENNKKWGDLSAFDVTVTGAEDGKSYMVTPNPKEPLSETAREAWDGLVRNGFDLRVLLENKDPFMVSGGSPAESNELLDPQFEETDTIPF